MRRRMLLFASLALLALSAPAVAGELPKPSPNRAYMDTTCSPCRDFYQFSNGAWLATAEIPPSYSGIGAGREMADRNQEAQRSVLERVSADPAAQKDATIRKLGEFYRVLMDSARADREGAAPLREPLARIAAIRTQADLQRELAHAALVGLGASMWGGGGLPFRFGAEPDPTSSRDMIAQFTQGGLGLPDRDYYFRDDEKSKQLRADYVTFMTNMFVLAGDAPEAAAGKAAAVFALETALADSSLSAVQMRDPKGLVHKMTVRELGMMAPGFDWPGYLKAIGLPGQAAPGTVVDVSVPGFVRHAVRLMNERPLETWRAYLEWNVLRARGGWCGQKFFAESFAFQAKLMGSRAPLPRWKRASTVCDGMMGEALGKAFVEENFPPSSKARMVEMVNNLRAALRERIASRPWMSAATKAQATHKLDTILQKIGYPDRWRDYSGLSIDPALAAATNIERASEFQRRWELSMIGKPVDRSIWLLSPPTVNAYYNPTFNEIVFPAGILMPPQFDPRADDAVNYGAIGMVIGHELTHGFDDEGRLYDADGNLKDWWTAEDSKRFEALAEQVVRQYDGYVAVDTLHLNGKLTLGENLADLGGITIAFRAWQRSLGGKSAPVIDGFTGEQRFFLGMAQGWRRKFRPEMLRTQVLSDPHSTASWRVNGPLSNLEAFRRAFGCKAGDPMVRAESIEIW